MRTDTIKNTVKKIFFDLLSFNTPQARVFNLSAILAGLAALPTEYLSYSPMKCVFKHFILPAVFGGVCPEDGFFAGCDCPACGMTRGMSRLLHGDIAGAYAFNPGVFLVLVVMLVVLGFNLAKSIKQYKKTGKIF